MRFRIRTARGRLCHEFEVASVEDAKEVYRGYYYPSDPEWMPHVVKNIHRNYVLYHATVEMQGMLFSNDPPKETEVEFKVRWRTKNA